MKCCVLVPGSLLCLPLGRPLWLQCLSSPSCAAGRRAVQGRL